MATPVTNFGLVTVSGAYGAADTVIALSTGDGSRLPVTTGGYRYPLTWWNATDYAHPADDPNREIVLVTNRATDTLTVTRAQEGTSATTKNQASKTYRMSLGVTKAMWEGLSRPRSWHQGLQLQTHRDADLAHKMVELVDVESIIMDDGTELRNEAGEWNGKTADVTVSGAGGLDLGVEDLSTLYEIFAIAKEDGTRNLLLHRSKNWVETNFIAGEDATQGIRSAVDNSTVKVAQGIKIVGAGGRIPLVQLKLLKVGSPTGNIWVTIETDSAGKPSGAAVATSEKIAVANLSTTARWVMFPMRSSGVLSVSPTQYHLVVQGDWTVSASNYVGWRMDGSAGTYANGAKALYDSDTATWTTDTDDDLVFELVVETNDTAVSLPTDYTKKCFLGWVYNDVNSVFVPFTQTGRTRQNTSYSPTTSTGIYLTDDPELVTLLVGDLPPRRILKAKVGVSGTGTSGALVALGDVTANNISSSGDTAGAHTLLSPVVTTQVPTAFAWVMMRYKGFMVHGKLNAGLFVVGYEWE